jgi:lysyl-tRNA synthetase class I
VFVIACSTCHRRQLIFPTQVVRVDGPHVTYRCWCGSEQLWTPGETSAVAA